MPTETELTLEQTQQGVSHEVSIRYYSWKSVVKKILLKLNLSDHRLCKMVVEVPDSSWLLKIHNHMLYYDRPNIKVIMKAQNCLSDYDCWDIRYHPGKANVVANALSRKERTDPLRVRALVMTIDLDLPKRILEAQIEAQKPENLVNEDVGGVGYLAMDTNILLTSQYVSKMALTGCGRVRPTPKAIRTVSGKERILPQIIVFVMERFPFKFSGDSLSEALGTIFSMSNAYHPETDGQSERTIQTLEDMLRACVIDFGKGWVKHLPIAEFSYKQLLSR
ncbi:putative reverse transcriptase domain-containing protein [Tanacetum coccineum]